MTLRSSVVLLLAVAMSSPAFAQDDDDLAPLVPIGKPKSKLKPKPKPVSKPKPPAAVDDDLAPIAPIAPIAANGELNVKLATPLAGSMLSIDGQEMGELPLPPQDVPSGEHTVTIKKPGYASFTKKVLVPGGKTVEVEAKLSAVAAVLSVTSNVSGAQVLLNGRPIGTVPLVDLEVPVGPAQIAVIKEGFLEDAQKINFVAGKDYPLAVKLIAADRPVEPKLTPKVGPSTPVTSVSVAPAEPITSKWYFWAGIAAGVAVVAAVGVGVGVGAQGPRPLNESDICGPSGCDGCIGLSCGAGARPFGSF